MPLTTPPVARTAMRIRRPVAEVFAAFVDPAITAKFWFTRGSARLTEGALVMWHWDMYGFAAEVRVTALELNRRIVVEWPTPVFVADHSPDSHVADGAEPGAETQSRKPDARRAASCATAGAR